VEDEPNDEAPSQLEPTQLPRAVSDIIGGDKVGGDKIGGDKVMGDQWNISTAGGDYIDVRGRAVYYQPAITPLDRQQQRNRLAMLAKVKTIWIDGLLEHSLAKELRIALDLTERPYAVELPLNALVQELSRAPRPLPPDTPIIKVFEQMGG